PRGRRLVVGVLGQRAWAGRVLSTRRLLMNIGTRLKPVRLQPTARTRMICDRQFRPWGSEYGRVCSALSEPLALLAYGAASSVRRAERRLAMATATKQSRAVGELVRRVAEVR